MCARRSAGELTRLRRERLPAATERRARGHAAPSPRARVTTAAVREAGDHRRVDSNDSTASVRSHDDAKVANGQSATNRPRSRPEHGAEGKGGDRLVEAASVDSLRSRHRACGKLIARAGPRLAIGAVARRRHPGAMPYAKQAAPRGPAVSAAGRPWPAGDEERRSSAGDQPPYQVKPVPPRSC